FNTTSGAWTYTLDQGLADHLTAGQHVTDTLTVTSAQESTPQNTSDETTCYDDFCIKTTTAAEHTAVTEHGGLANDIAGDPTASSQLTVHDVYNGYDHFPNPPSFPTRRSSDLFNTTSGAWTYTLDQGLADHLTAGQHVTDTLTVTSSDGTATQNIVVNITGTNDVATITTSAAHTTELHSGGRLVCPLVRDQNDPCQPTAHHAHTDLDNSTNPASRAITSLSLPDALPICAWTYTLDQGLADHLTAGQHVTDTLTVTSSDGTATQNIVVNITGTNDVATIT